MAETVITAAREEHRYYPYQGIFYLARHSFWAAGQDSWTNPPAQNPDSFSVLSNVEPVLQGILERRRGYGLFSLQAPSVPYSLGYSFRNDLLGLRSVVFTSPSNILATTETGAPWLNPVLTPSAGASQPRMVLSRNFGYFADGLTVDNKKWDGTNVGGNLTNWGISFVAGSTGPNVAGTATDLGAGGGGSGSQGPQAGSAAASDGTGTSAWNITGSIALSGGTASVTQLLLHDDNSDLFSDNLKVTNFGFSVPLTATILGITATYSRTGSSGTVGVFDNAIRLIKGGVIGGTDHSNLVRWGTGGPEVYGGSSDLWGQTWTPSDINSSNFGIAVSCFATNSSSLNKTVTGTIFAPIQLTVTYSAPVGTGWTNPNGIVGACDNVVASVTASASPTADLRASNYGFGSVSGQVTGIQVVITASTGNGGVPINLNPILVKAGVATGTRKSLVVNSTGLTTYVFGGQFDLWGGSWLASDFNAVTTFGVQFNVNTLSNQALFSVDCVAITVFTQPGPITITGTGSGNINLLSGRTYFYVFQNSRVGTTSTLSPASLSTGPLTNSDVILGSLPTHPDPQVDTILILATADGNDQTTLYLVGSVPNGTAGFTDNTPDALTAAVPSGPALLTNPLYQDTDAFGLLHGVANNNPPPAILFPVKHKGRIYGAKGSTLYFSKNLDEVTTANGLTTSKWEEAWPATNSLDISETAETIRGLLSDGETLWIGTERTIRRLIGDSPQNFQKPEIQFNETGLFNQDVWRVVFYEGQPVGTMWLTPDLRVISSDFNTYQDVGWPIQDVLNSVNIGASFGPQAAFVSKGPADYYMLYLPTGVNNSPDTICVYNLRTQKWFIWRPTDLAPGSVFFIDVSGQPRWLFTSTAGPIYEWTAGSLLDRVGNGPVSFPVTIQTSWLDFGDSNLRKVLNQLLYLGGDNTLSVQVEGAVLDTELDVGSFPVLAATTLATGPLQDLYLPMAQTNSKHRWYRFTFLSQANSVSDVLDGFSIEAMGLFRY